MFDYINEAQKEQEAWFQYDNTDPSWSAPDLSPLTVKEPEDVDPELLPKSVKNYLQDTCRRMQIPLCFTLPPFFVAVASAIGRRATIYPKANDHSYSIVPTTWGALIAQASSQKSPAFNEVLSPLKKLQKETFSIFEDKNKSWRHKQADLETEMKGKENQLKRIYAGQGKQIEIEEIDAIKERIQELRDALENGRPVWERFIVNDVTQAMLQSLLAENPNGLLSVNDELARLLKTLDKKGNEADRGFLLETWAGDQSYTTDRIGRGTQTAHGLCLSILGTIQPSALSKYLDQSKKLYGEDGFINRFQVLVTSSCKPTYEYIDEAADPEETQNYENLFRFLVSIGSSESPKKFTFSDEAQMLYVDWLSELEVRLRAGSLSTIMQSHLGKYRSLMPSVSLILYLCEQPINTKIPLECAKKAAAICEYLESHAHIILDENEVAVIKLAASFERKIRDGIVYDGMTMRDFRRKLSLKKSTDGTDNTLAAIDLIENRRWIRIKTRENKFGPNSEIIQINPKLKEIYGKPIEMA